MSRATTLTTLGAAIAMAATPIAAEETTAPQAPDISSQYSIANANPEKGTATIQGDVIGGESYQYNLSCDELSFQQERIESDIIRNGSTFIALGTDDLRYQEHKLELGFNHTTLGEVYRYASDDTIQRNEESGGLTYAAELGADRQVFVKAQIEAGCFTPKGLVERGLPAPRP